MTPRRIVFAGTPDFSVPCLQALLDHGCEVPAVYTQPDRPAGRGRKLHASPIKQLAAARGIPVYQPQSLKKAAAQEELAALAPELLVVIAYGLILPQKVLDIPTQGCINVHASLLPRWRGAAPIQRALLAGDAGTGITIMQMEAGLDTGPMLLKNTTPIRPDDIGQTLHDRLASLGAESLIQALERWDSLTPEVQDDGLATYARKLEKSEAALAWDDSAESLERKVRAFNPWPVAQGRVRELELRVWRAKTLPENLSATPGTIVRANKQGIDIACGEGVLRLLQVQKAGGKPLAAEDFLNGHPDWITR